MVYTIFGDNLSNKRKYIVYILLFYILNIINTYFVTTAVLNRYLMSFSRTVRLEMNAIVGNFGVLTVLLFLGFMFIKSYKKRSYYMIIVTFLLNFALFALGIFTKYYQTIFSVYEMTLMKNPSQALGISILLEALKELFTYYRIVVFIPTIIMVGYHHFLKYKDNIYHFDEEPIFSYLPLNNMIVIAGMIFSLFSLGIFNVSMNQHWQIFAERPLYGVQTAGLYNYYFGQFMGFRYQDEHIIELDPEAFDSYNKNKQSYTNLWGENYSNTLTLSDASTVILDPKIERASLNGIFKDKNLVLIHLESLNHFLLEERGYLDESYYSFLKQLLKESYLLDNFYTNVGLGNSSDAEFSVLTGLYPTGDTTLYWKYEDNNYTFDALPKLFKRQNYISNSLHGDVLEFYNRGPVHEEMFGFENYFYFNPKEANYPGTKNGYYLFSDVQTPTPDSPWLSDVSLLNWTKELYDKSDHKQFLYPVNIQPHVPYLYDEFEQEPRFNKQELPIDAVALKYLNYEKSVENYFKAFVEMTKSFKNTVYVFYSDHGSGITLDDYATILGYKVESLANVDKGSSDEVITKQEYNKEMLRTLAFIYAPDDEDTSPIKKGLIKGVQPKVRSQVDVYRTIIELFGLEVDNPYYGVNLLSDESTFSIDTRTFSIITDDFYIISKRFLQNEITKENTIMYQENPKVQPQEIFRYIYLFKQRMDKALRDNLFQYL